MVLGNSEAIPTTRREAQNSNLYNNQNNQCHVVSNIHFKHQILIYNIYSLFLTIYEQGLDTKDSY